jgi:hypothetical protein
MDLLIGMDLIKKIYRVLLQIFNNMRAEPSQVSSRGGKLLVVLGECRVQPANQPPPPIQSNPRNPP